MTTPDVRNLDSSVSSDESQTSTVVDDGSPVRNTVMVKAETDSGSRPKDIQGSQAPSHTREARHVEPLAQDSFKVKVKGLIRCMWRYLRAVFVRVRSFTSYRVEIKRVVLGVLECVVVRSVSLKLTSQSRPLTLRSFNVVLRHGIEGDEIHSGIHKAIC